VEKKKMILIDPTQRKVHFSFDIDNLEMEKFSFLFVCPICSSVTFSDGFISSDTKIIFKSMLTEII